MNNLVSFKTSFECEDVSSLSAQSTTDISIDLYLDYLDKACEDSAGKVALLHALLKRKQHRRKQLKDHIVNARHFNHSLRRNVKVAFGKRALVTRTRFESSPVEVSGTALGP
jgi:hypothetical protein